MSSTAGERTEKATPKRLKEAREQGRLATSKDMTGWISIASCALVLPAVVGSGTAAGQQVFAQVRQVAMQPDPDADAALRLVGDALGTVPGIIGPLLAAGVVGAIVGALLSGGIHPRRFRVKFDHFNPVSGAARMVGPQALWEGAKALLKTAVVGVAVFVSVQGVLPLMSASGAMPVDSVVQTAVGVAVAVMQAAIVAGVALGALDVLVVRRRNRKHTMMTRQELKDENKSTDGDPLVKSQRRQRQMALSRNRMIQAVGEADVVLLNPTHVAVALKYERGKSAPRVIAKGAGEVAAKIRERASELRVPMVQDVPLARGLYAACDVGQEIPEELYTAVARVLAFVMSLRRRGAALGVHTMH